MTPGMRLSLTVLLSLAVLAFCDKGRRRLTSSAYGFPGINATFDYVVVGGGTAGLAIASRLAETTSVAVVEAGGFHDQDNGNGSVVPFYALTGQPFLDNTENYPRQPLFDWDLVSVPQPAAAGRSIHYAQAKTLGGCSAHNTLAYLRATKGFHDRWAAVAGDDTYKWENFLQYFKKSCTLTPPDWEKRNTPNATFKYDPSAFNKGKGGPIQVSWANWVDPTTTWLVIALQSVGLRLSTLGFSSGILAGFSAWIPVTVDPRSAERSTARAYLDASIQATDIMVYHHTQGLKINFDPSTKHATSVLVSTAGAQYTLHATKEIILSAGVFHTPQLLLVSGIGPAATLAAHSIPLIADLPGVGANLHDPLLLSVRWGLDPSLPSAIGLATSPDPAVQASILESYLQDQSGPLASISNHLAFEKLPRHLRDRLSPQTRKRLDEEWPEPDWPDLEWIVGAGAPGVGAVTAVLLNPFSRGTVSIKSASMADPPIIDLGWLTDEADGEMAVAAVRRAREMWNASSLAPVKVGGEIEPGHALQSDEEVLGWVRKACGQIWHASSTCSMGREGDGMAVVDGQGRVFGVRGLRVVDLSVVPWSPPTHPQATVYALAEKIADDIVRGRGRE